MATRATDRKGTEKGRRTTQPTVELIRQENARRAEYEHVSNKTTYGRLEDAYNRTQQRMKDVESGTANHGYTVEGYSSKYDEKKHKAFAEGKKRPTVEDKKY